MDLITEIGGLSRGLFIIAGVILFAWQTYNRDSKLASSLLLERHKQDKMEEVDRDSDRENLQGDKDNGRRPSARTEKIHNWARKRFKNRSKFLYPSFCSCLISKVNCCRRGRATKERLYFAEEKLRKELDVARFIN